MTDLFAVHSYTPEGTSQGASQQGSKLQTHQLKKKKIENKIKIQFKNLKNIKKKKKRDRKKGLSEIFHHQIF